MAIASNSTNIAEREKNPTYFATRYSNRIAMKHYLVKTENNKPEAKQKQRNYSDQRAR